MDWDLTEQEYEELIDMQNHLDWLRNVDRLREMGIWV